MSAEPEKTKADPAGSTFLEGLPRMLLALAIGTIGGTIFSYLSMPLPWMLGAMLATAIASFSGVPVRVDPRLRTLMIVVLGTLLGSAFSPEIIDRAVEWPISLTALFGYVIMASLLTFWFYHRVARIPPNTAFFSGVPGGLAEMVMLGTAAGGDDRKISLAHTTRIFMVVMILPLAFRILGDFDGTAGARNAVKLLDLSATDFALLAASAIVGYWLARLLRIPAPQLTGPMVVSAAVHLTGLTSAAPPFLLVAIAQVVIGSTVGSRFAGMKLREVARYLRLGVVSTVLLLALTVVYAFALENLMDVPFDTFVLAFSPGGLTEMSLIALAMQIDTAFVATHHMARIFIIVVMTPHLFRFMKWTGIIDKPDSPA